MAAETPQHGGSMEEKLRFRVQFDFSEAKRAAREARRVFKGLGDEFGKGVDESEKKVEKYDRTLARTGRTARRVGRDIGGLNRTLGRNVQAFGALTAIAGSASGVLGPAGILAAGAGAGYLVAASGAAVLAEKIYTATVSARELHETLKPHHDVAGLLPDITASDLAAFDEARAAVDGARVSYQALQLTVASEFAPALADSATGVIAATLYVRDLTGVVIGAYEAYQQLDGAVGVVADAIMGQFRGALLLASPPLLYLIDAARMGVDVLRDLGDSTGYYGRTARAVVGDVEELNEQLRIQDEITAALSAQQKALGDAARKAGRRAREEERQRRKDAADAAREQREEEQRLAGIARATEAARGIQRDAARSLMSPEEKLLDTYIRQKEQLDKLQAAGADATAIEAARIAIWEKYDAALDSLDEERAMREKEAARRREKEAERAAEAEKRLTEQAAADRQRQLQQLGGYATQGLSLIATTAEEGFQSAGDAAARLQAQLAAGEELYTAAQKRALRARIDAQKDAAREAFQDAQQAKLAEAAASTALGVINAISQAPPPSPFGLIGAGIVTAAGLQAQTQIASQKPTFHRGGLGDEYSATLTRSEAVLSPLGRQKMGDENIERANRGQSAGGDRIIVVERYRHRVYNRFIRDNLRRGGPLADAFAADRNVGYRTDRKGI